MFSTRATNCRTCVVPDGRKKISSNNSLLVSKLRVNQAWGYAYGQLDTLGALGHETFMHMILVSTRRERHQV